MSIFKGILKHFLPAMRIITRLYHYYQAVWLNGWVFAGWKTENMLFPSKILNTSQNGGNCSLLRRIQRETLYSLTPVIFQEREYTPFLQALVNKSFSDFFAPILLMKTKQEQTHLTVSFKELFLVYVRSLFWQPCFWS